jgi:thiol-disulfide isomerase/thioredoxin
MRRILTWTALLLFATVALASSPRSSPELTIREPGKPALLLSSFRGQVVVVEFLFVRSPHCQRLAQVLNKLHTELGPKGLQPVAIAFDPPSGSTGGLQAVSFMTQYLGLTYPVGYAAKDEVDTYLARAQNEILNIPQLVVIDRNGVIRASTGAKGGNSTLENEDQLRTLLNSLLQEHGPGFNTH